MNKERENIKKNEVNLQFARRKKNVEIDEIEKIDEDEKKCESNELKVEINSD